MKVASARLLPVKYPAYQAVAELNRSFEQTIDSLEHLTSFNFFRRDQLRYYQVMLEEVRSLVSQGLTEIITGREFENSVHYEKLRLQQESRRSDPREALVETTRSRQQTKQPKEKQKRSQKPPGKTA
jgi:hypothetical protein